MLDQLLKQHVVGHPLGLIFLANTLIHFLLRLLVSPFELFNQLGHIP